MYREPYNSRINLEVSQKIDKTNDAIIDEYNREDGKIDKRKILRLYEQKLMQGGMLNSVDGVYGKYRQPW